MTAVVVIHVTAINFYSTDKLAFQTWIIHIIFNCLARWAVPVFVMVSGAIFLDPERPLRTRKLFSKYIPRLLVMYLLWSALYLFIDIALYKKNMSAGVLINTWISGHYHLWYLPMCISLYLVTPVVRKIVIDKKVVQYFLILAFVVTFTVPTVLEFLKLIDGRLFDIGSLFAKQFQIYLPIGYISYFVLGNFINKSLIERKTEYQIYLLGAGGFIYTVLMTVIASKKLNDYTGFLSNTSVNVLFESIAVFVFAKKHLNTIGNGSIEKMVRYLAKYSFGVYLIHAFIVDLIKNFANDILVFYPVVSVPITVITVVVLSLACTVVLHKIPFVNRFL